MERPLVITEPVGTAVEIKVEGALFSLVDLFGEPLIGTDEEPYGVRTGSVTTEREGPHFVLLFPDENNHEPFHIKSNREMVRYEDRDDGKRIKVGETMPASMDYPSPGLSTPLAIKALTWSMKSSGLARAPCSFPLSRGFSAP